MNTFFRDLRFGARVALRQPGSAILSVLVLAVGIGSSTAVFSVVNAVLIRPLPYREPDRLVILWDNFTRLGMDKLGVKPAEYVDYREQSHVFEDIAAFSNLEVNISGDDTPERLRAARVTANLFALLGSEASVGRMFREDDQKLGVDSIVILSDGLWKRRFSSDPTIVGRTVTINGQPRTVLGIMPAGFEFPHRSFWFAEPAELWLPLVITPEDVATRRGPFNLRVIARLNSDSSLERARSDMNAIAARLENQYEGYRGPGG
ncbi:MAG TPA: ABC transporter permease, partial [Blastocatellia bacterium]|nr:ABC transporter permease [Blastocatellia bacterium]